MTTIMVRTGGEMTLRLNQVCAWMLVAGALAGPMAPGAEAQEAVYLVRHAERLDESADSPLSPEGEARAARLAVMLRDAGITKVFATQYRRTADTGKPLAATLGVPVVQIDAGRHRALLDAVRAEGPRARVLIVGHSDTVAELLELIGDGRPVTIAKAEYDNLFVVVPGGGSPPVVLRLRY
jgi:broad specificity phosphatase PhoE